MAITFQFSIPAANFCPLMQLLPFCHCLQHLLPSSIFVLPLWLLNIVFMLYWLPEHPEKWDTNLQAQLPNPPPSDIQPSTLNPKTFIDKRYWIHFLDRAKTYYFSQYHNICGLQDFTP